MQAVLMLVHVQFDRQSRDSEQGPHKNCLNVLIRSNAINQYCKLDQKINFDFNSYRNNNDLFVKLFISKLVYLPRVMRGPCLACHVDTWSSLVADFPMSLFLRCVGLLYLSSDDIVMQPCCIYASSYLASYNACLTCIFSREEGIQQALLMRYHQYKKIEFSLFFFGLKSVEDFHFCVLILIIIIYDLCNIPFKVSCFTMTWNYIYTHTHTHARTITFYLIR